METEPITSNGAKKLQDELSDLINNKRQKVIQAIAEAREHGDLKENAEYHAAKEEQGHIEGRIQEIQLLLANAEIIDISNIPKNQKTVVFGATVEVEDIDNDFDDLVFELFDNPDGMNLIFNDFKSAIDLGTGSGILAISAKSLGAKRVMGLEYDPICEQNFIDNLELNGNIISSTDTNGEVTLKPHGTGSVGIAAANTANNVLG